MIYHDVAYYSSFNCSDIGEKIFHGYTYRPLCICGPKSGRQGSFPAGTPGNRVPKVILTVGTAFKPALGELWQIW